VFVKKAPDESIGFLRFGRSCEQEYVSVAETFQNEKLRLYSSELEGHIAGEKIA
jgi:hypothetical protein